MCKAAKTDTFLNKCLLSFPRTNVLNGMIVPIQENIGENMRDFNRGGGGGFKRSFGPREMHKATCSECGQECEVPFKPADGKPVYCKECYMKKKKY